MKQPDKQVTTAKQGLVISYFGNSVAVEDPDGQVFQCHLRRNQALPVVGDRVEWQLEKSNTGVILGIAPRTSLLSRGDAKGKTKPIAANVDFIVIVMAPPPIFSEYLVDRYLIAASLLDIQPIIVMNKVDLLSASAREDAQVKLKPYADIPYPTALTSVLSHEGLAELNDLLKDKTAVLVGPSGVGKSSIISSLTTDIDIKVGEVSAKGSGKHTTTATRLYHLPQGGKLIDSPGVREFALWPVDKKDILRGFKEFTPFLDACKFRDCQHVAEPGCAVQEAVASGKISPNRYANYQQLIKELKKTS